MYFRMPEYIVLFEFFDFNDKGYLEEVELQFVLHTIIQGTFKLFNMSFEFGGEDAF